MLEAFYATERGSLEDATINGGFDLHPDLVWIDLIAPSQEEQQWVLDAYEQNLPTLKSLEDISSSARFYRDDDGILHISTYFLTKNKNFQVDGEPDDNSSILATVQTVAFILHKERLFTLRGEKLVAFRAFRARARRNDYEIDYKDPTWVLLGLLEAETFFAPKGTHKLGASRRKPREERSACRGLSVWRGSPSRRGS